MFAELVSALTEVSAHEDKRQQLVPMLRQTEDQTQNVFLSSHPTFKAYSNIRCRHTADFCSRLVDCAKAMTPLTSSCRLLKSDK